MNNRMSKSKRSQLKSILADLKYGDRILVWIADNSRKITKEEAKVVQDGPFDVDSDLIKIELPVSPGSNVKEQLSIPAKDIIRKI